MEQAKPTATANVTVGARARVRAEITNEIKATARGHLAASGADGLSLRAVARDLGMASSAVYRYFPSRDDLLTALIVDGYDAVGAEAERADAQAPPGAAARWHALAHAVRRWARAHPHDYALVYGSPVPGYRAPRDTVSPATRVTRVALGIVAAGVADGEIDATPKGAVPPTVRADLDRLRQVATPDVPDEVLIRLLVVWSALFGAISLELFGHLDGVVEHGDAVFERLVATAANLLIRGPAPG